MKSHLQLIRTSSPSFFSTSYRSLHHIPPTHPRSGPVSFQGIRCFGHHPERACVPRTSISHTHSDGDIIKLHSLSRDPRTQPLDEPRLLQSSTAPLPLIVATLILAGGLYYIFTDSLSEPELAAEPSENVAWTLNMSIPEGRPGHLTPEQEEKLRKLWQAVFQITSDARDEGTTENIPSDAKDETHKKKRFGLVRNKTDKSSPDEQTPKDIEEDKYGLNNQFHEVIANRSPEVIRSTIWSMVKCDHPDALFLRFLRARKWDVDKALVMMISTMNWRRNEMHVDDDVMWNGEESMAIDENEGKDPHAKTVGADFMQQIRLGKSFLHGTDKQGRPICVVRVRLHKQGEQCEESLERYTVYIIETARMVLKAPVDTATIIFDMTGFSMANMDYAPVKFMIKCFEANYPESLGAVLVHNAPWVFQGIWKIIRGWLDPVVAAKVHFTNNTKDLEDFIPHSQIIKELGGAEDWSYQYAEPRPGENAKMADKATRDRLLSEREEQVKAFEAATERWIENIAGDGGKKAKSERESLAEKLKAGYWTLDPYVRARSLYDRQRAIKEGGSVDWYSNNDTANVTNGEHKKAENGHEESLPATEISAADVD